MFCDMDTAVHLGCRGLVQVADARRNNLSRATNLCVRILTENVNYNEMCQYFCESGILEYILSEFAELT